MNKDIVKKFELPSRLVGLDKNVWIEYIQLANKYNPINLGQGFPDFSPPDTALEAYAQTAVADAPLHQYTKSAGHPRLVNAISKLYSPLINHEIDPTNDVIIGVGATEVLFCILFGHLQPGDEAIVIEPFFDCYLPMIKMAGAKPVFVPLVYRSSNLCSASKTMSSKDWVIDKEELKKAFNNNTKLIVLNTPHNPTGKVFSEEELTFVGDLCKKYNTLCISDEVYEWMIYKPNKHVRIASLPGMWERTITVGSAGKSFSVTGWKIGWAYGPSNLMKNLRVVHQNCVYVCSTVLQEAVAIAIEKAVKNFGKENCYFEELKNLLEPKRDRVVQMIEDVGMNPVVPQGGYFIVADWTALSSKVDLSEEQDNERDYKFSKWMTKNVGVLTIPPSSFYCDEHKYMGESFIRFCFIKEDRNLDKAADRLKRWKQKMKN